MHHQPPTLSSAKPSFTGCIVAVSFRNTTGGVVHEGGNGTEAHAAPNTRAAVTAAPAPAPALLPPAEAYQFVARDGARKAAMSPVQTFAKALYAGAYISFGGLLSLTVLNACPGLTASNPGLAKLLFALVFPVGLYLNIMHGAELFTGNTMALPAAVYEGKATIGGLIKNWVFSYAGNLLGSLAFVAAVAASGILADATMPVKMATMKTSLTWGQVRYRVVA